MMTPVPTQRGWRDVDEQQEEAARIFAELERMSKRLVVAVDDYLDSLNPIESGT